MTGNAAGYVAAQLYYDAYNARFGSGMGGTILMLVLPGSTMLLYALLPVCCFSIFLGLHSVVKRHLQASSAVVHARCALEHTFRAGRRSLIAFHIYTALGFYCLFAGRSVSACTMAWHTIMQLCDRLSCVLVGA